MKPAGYSGLIDPALLGAKSCWNGCRRKNTETITFREILQSGPNQLRTKASADAALATLLSPRLRICLAPASEIRIVGGPGGHCSRLLLAWSYHPDELALYRQCTGQTVPPGAPASYLWLVIGRRGGKSFAMASRPRFFIDIVKAY
jgi:hypothetical protein